MQKGVEIDADFLALSASDESQPVVDTKFDRRNFPSEFQMPAMQICFKDIGKVDLQMSRSNSGMSVDSLSVAMRNGNIEATGNWYIGDELDSTRLQGKFVSDDVGSLKQLT